MFRASLPRYAAIALALALGGTSAARAQDTTTTAKWENTVTLYGWAAALSGSMGIRVLDVSVDVPFSDILDNLKGALMFNYTGRGERLVAGTDFIYMDLGSDLSTPNTNTPLAEVRLKQWLIEGDVGYRVTPWMDALLGVRIPVIEGEIIPDGNVPAISERSRTESWVAPLIGARVMLPATRHLTVVGRGDLGGFGLGGTNNTWQAAGYLNYAFGKGWSASLGYRAISAGYATGTEGQPDYFKYDVTSSGGVLGVSFTF